MSSKYAHISDEEIRQRDSALISRFQKHNDVQAFVTLRSYYLPLITGTTQFKHRSNSNIPFGDLERASDEGFWRAAQSYDPNKGKLSNYAIYWMRQKMDVAILEYRGLKNSTNLKKVYSQFSRVADKLSNAVHGETYDIRLEKTAKELGMKPKTLQSAFNRLAKPHVSIDSTLGHEDDRSLSNIIPDKALNPEETLVHHDELQHRTGFLNTALNSLKERERYILEQRKLSDEPKTLDDLAKEFDLTRERIRQIEVRALEKVTQMTLALNQQMLNRTPEV